MPDSFADGARILVVGPKAAARVIIRSKVGSGNRARKIQYRQHLTSQLHPRHIGRAMLAPFLGRMAALATQQPLRQITASGHASRSALALPVGYGPHSSADKY